MAEHDDELDRRITALLGAAQQDAPDPQSATLPRPRRSARWLAVAAAVALVGGGFAALAMRDDPESALPTDSTSSPTTVPSDDSQLVTSSSAATSSTSPTPRDCSAPAVDSYDTVGSMHTIVQSSQALDVSIEAPDAPWCPGGTGTVRLTVTNVGIGQERLDGVLLILNGGMNKYQLAHTASADEPDVLSLAPGAGVTVDYHVDVPSVPPGSYSLQLYGFGNGRDIRIDGPSACATNDLSAVAGAGDGAGQHEMTPVTVTNIGGTPCFLGRPLIVMGTGPNATGPTQIPFEDGGFFPVDDPRPSRVLQPGESTSVVLTTVNSCLDGASPPVYWSALQIEMSVPGDATIGVALGPDNFLQTQCGLALSGWA